MTARTVVKFGGSLMDKAGEILAEIPDGPILIVPGGGIFADFVRAQGADDETSHWKAIDAMEIFGRFLSTFGYPVTRELTIPKEPSILLPKRLLEKADPLPHTWDVTSDSIAAWIAGLTGSRLLVIKSTDSGEDLLDPVFGSLIAEYGVSAEILNGRVPGSVRSWFEATRL
ncbi:MAG: uridylate kinase [Methanocorpusculum sp.]|jgi:5-(aminomethyl)-3-furanmethanol phosphate kinase|nr:uridylate kinase [Methanocorpusculum sp. GPch4]MDD2803254.1 uridylate kinase [Methanocorpusculum sp.]NLC91441.1 uridylate kinase [Methanocorpusculum parvum]MDD3047225.1 uridylate kinase [Methanocorpusculum sp.]MDD3912466.1 uridylate kinase [Methanocorpusculum sp.]MDY3202511.1 uridylate kinase [Methanocorpusculum sp.]